MNVNPTLQPSRPASLHPGTNGKTPFSVLLDRLLDDQPLRETDAERLMDDILDGALGPERLAAFITALRARPPQADGLAGMALSLRRHARPVERAPGLLLDTCGTGAARLKTFNASTSTAFVVAACGVPVAKHGNRSVTRPSGSSDLLESAGARLDLDPAQAGALLARLGIVVLHAPTHHPSLRHAADVRKALGVRTVFNLLGPLCNPAAPTHQVLGVAEPRLLRPMADALVRLGCDEAYVLHGEPGFDDASPAGLVHTLRVHQGKVGPPRVVTPEEVGIAPCHPDALAPVGKDEAPALARAVLDGRAGPRSDMVAFNAAFALHLAGRSATLADGVRDARAAMDSGRPRALFDAYVAATRGA